MGMEMLQHRVDAPAEPTAEVQGSDRRIWYRVGAEELKGFTAQLATGGAIRLLDLSRSGARFESERRFLPNSTVALQLVTADGTLMIRGRVARSRIVRMGQGGLGYEVGVSFNELLKPTLGKPVGEGSEADPPRADAAAPSAPAPGSGGDERPSDWGEPMMTVTAAVSSSADDVRDLLDGNDW